MIKTAKVVHITKTYCNKWNKNNTTMSMAHCKP